MTLAQYKLARGITVGHLKKNLMSPNVAVIMSRELVQETRKILNRIESEFSMYGRRDAARAARIVLS